jgi:hypothetical protein
MSSQDVFNIYSQIPEYITNSDSFKSKIDHLPNQVRSEKRVLKNINETLNLLKEAGTSEALEQRKIIVGAIYDSRFGFPKLSETKRVLKESKQCKIKMISGE